MKRIFVALLVLSMLPVISATSASGASRGTVAPSLATAQERANPQSLLRAAPAAKSKPGFVKVIIAGAKGVPVKDRKVVLFQGARRIVVGKTGVVRLPNSNLWNVTSPAASLANGSVATPLANRGNVKPDARAKVAKLKAGAAVVRVDYSSRTAVPAALIETGDLTGPIVPSQTGTLDDEGIEGFPLLSVPTKNVTQKDDYVIIDNTVKGFTNGFVGKIVERKDGSVTLEAVNPFTVINTDGFESEAEGTFNFGGPVDEPQASLLRAGVSKNMSCSSQNLRDYLSTLTPSLKVDFKSKGTSIESFGFTIGVRSVNANTSQLTLSGTAECRGSLTVKIKTPLGAQTNVKLSVFASVSASGRINFSTASTNATVGYTIKPGDLEPTQTGGVTIPTPSIDDQPGVELEATLLGFGGEIALQWPADIELPGFTAGANVSIFIGTDIDLIELAAPAELPACNLERYTQVNLTAGVRATAKVRILLWGVEAEAQATALNWESDAFWENCLLDTKDIEEVVEVGGGDVINVPMAQAGMTKITGETGIVAVGTGRGRGFTWELPYDRYAGRRVPFYAAKEGTTV